MFIQSLALLGYRPFVNGFFKKFPQHLKYKTNRPKDFTDLIKAFHEDFIQSVTDNRHGTDLPLKCGNIRIIAYKKNRDYPVFKKWQLVGSHTNNHSDGLQCKIEYRNKGNRYKFKDKIMWSFEPEAPFRKKVSKAFKENYSRYIISPNRGQIDKRDNMFKWKEITDANIEEFLRTYNEFEIE